MRVTVLHAVQAAEPGYFSLFRHDRVFDFLLAFSVRRRQVLPFIIARGRDDAAVHHPSLAEAPLFGGGFRTGINNRVADALLVIAPEHRVNRFLSGPARGDHRDQ